MIEQLFFKYFREVFKNAVKFILRKKSQDRPLQKSCIGIFSTTFVNILPSSSTNYERVHVTYCSRVIEPYDLGHCNGIKKCRNSSSECAFTE